MSVLGDGSFTVHSWRPALLELVRDPQRPRYRLRAEVRHETSAKDSRIGIYVAHHIHPLPAGPIHQFVALAFYDIESEKELYDKNMSQPRRLRLPPPRGNPVTLDPHLYTEHEPEPWHAPILCGPRDYFEPVGVGGRMWRELMVEVTPDGIKGFWSGKVFGQLSSPLLLEFTNKYLAGIRKEQANDPFARDFEPIYAPRGGLGLFVSDGSASFRRVVIEPLEDIN
jgi:hypothetical protein